MPDELAANPEPPPRRAPVAPSGLLAYANTRIFPYCGASRARPARVARMVTAPYAYTVVFFPQSAYKDTRGFA